MRAPSSFQSLKLQLNLISRRQLDISPHPCQVKSANLQPEFPYARSFAAAYTSTAAAADTPRDPTRPRNGSETSRSQLEATRGRRPRPSEPSTSTTPPT